LTGGGTDLGLRFNWASGKWTDRIGSMSNCRESVLRRFAINKGLRIGRSIIPLGYVSDSVYYAILSRAWALVMPTLAEGFGFPVYEALVNGVPVICSDIPVLREQVERTGGTVLWFDPHDPSDLTRKLCFLQKNYECHKSQAVRQIAELRRRSWNDVAEDYWRALTRNRRDG